jgi:hypothetical protein
VRLRGAERALADETARCFGQELTNDEIVVREHPRQTRRLDRLDAALLVIDDRGLWAERFYIALRIRGERTERRSDDTPEALL